MTSKIKQKGIKRIIVLLIGLIAAGCILLPLIFNNLKFGLDLQGGFEVLYQVETVDGSEMDTDILTSTYKALLKRIDILGVSEPVITIEGDDQIRVQLAGVTDQEGAREVLSQTATLTFRDTDDNLLMTSEVLTSGGASVGQDQKGLPAVTLSIADTSKFYKETLAISKTDDQLLVVWLDYEDGKGYSTTENGSLCGTDSSNCLSSATVSQGFSSNEVQITGNFTTEEVQSLVDLINSGSLPTKLEEISSQTVDASFGVDSLDKTLLAGIVGILLIMIFMIVLYRFSGFVAAVGILLYTALTFGLFWLVGGVLTLPGIAAILLGIGMAVDANVLNFSRIKDELANKRDLQNAYKKGNTSSLGTIIDANITTLIVAVILFIFGESTVKGFATMLIISVLTTLFVMVFLVRKILDRVVASHYFDDKVTRFIGSSKQKQFKFNIVKNRKYYFITTIICVIIGIVSLVTVSLNLGIEFKGGTTVSIKSDNEIVENDIKTDIEELGFTYDSSDLIDDKTITVTIDESLGKDEVTSTESYFEDKYEASTDITVISNIVKAELIKNAIYSLVLAIIGIVLYISLRFKFNYAISAILCLLHDAFLVIILFSLLKLEVSTIFIAAILSIIGYSVNNTIVVFDRIKENYNKKGKIKNKEELSEVVNDSINQTINRSIITTITTLIPIISLIILGANEIISFNVALLIGLIAGTYSSLFLAGNLFNIFDKKNIGKDNRKKWYEID